MRRAYHDDEVELEREIEKGRMEEIVRAFAQRSVLVIGDLMADEYLRGSARRVSQEGPVLVVEVEADEFKPGGAANVGNSLRALGASVRIAGVVGDDEIGRVLRSELAAWNVDVMGIITDHTRQTTRKTRVVAQNQQVLRVDREHTHPVSQDIARQLLDYVAGALSSVDAVLVSDYRKGVLTSETAQAVCAQARAAGKPLSTNPKPASARWLRGAAVLSLNQFEAEELGRAPLPKEEQELEAFGERLRAELEVETLVITQGARGLSYWRQDGATRHLPAHAVEVTDGAGAGDTTISAMTLALICGATTYEAAAIANRAGACVVRKSGVATVSVEELLHFEG